MRVRLEGIMKAFKLFYVVYNVGCCPSVYHHALHFRISRWYLIASVLSFEEVRSNDVTSCAYHKHCETLYNTVP